MDNRYVMTPMTMERHTELIEFWDRIDGVWRSDDDNAANLSRYLARNPGLSQITLFEGKIIGTVKCGHDGRRGYLHHLAVLPDHRNQGIGRQMVKACLEKLRKEGIDKVRVFVLDDNPAAIRYWKHLGFIARNYDYRTLEWG